MESVSATASTPSFTKKISINEYNNNDEYKQKQLRELQEQMKSFKKPKISDDKESQNKSSSSKSSSSKSSSSKSSSKESDVSDSDYNLENEVFSNDEDSNEPESNKRKYKPDVNLIINNIVDRQKAKAKGNSNTNAKVSNQSASSNNLVDSIYAQRELDIKEIARLNKNIASLLQNIKDKQREVDDLEKKQHYANLESNNLQCELFDCKKQIETLKKDNKKISDDNQITDTKMKRYEFCLKLLKYFMILMFILNIYFQTFKYFLLIASVSLLFA